MDGWTEGYTDRDKWMDGQKGGQTDLILQDTSGYCQGSEKDFYLILIPRYQKSEGFSKMRPRE